MASYADKLKDPRWQKMRLEILARDRFTCQRCGDTKSTLHVHHLYYESGKDPWDYPVGSLVTVCESCHETIPSMEEEAFVELRSALNRAGFLPDSILVLARNIDFATKRGTANKRFLFSTLNDLLVHVFFCYGIRRLYGSILRHHRRYFGQNFYRKWGAMGPLDEVDCK